MTAVEPDGPRPWTMRAPCPDCASTRGTITTVAGQDVVRCECGRHCYNAPRHETGRPQRALATRPGLKPSTRARILERDNYTCVCCHRADLPLDIGHLLSVADGRRLGWTDAELDHDDNLAAMCQPCNSGQGQRSINPRLLAALIHARKAG